MKKFTRTSKSTAPGRKSTVDLVPLGDGSAIAYVDDEATAAGLARSLNTEPPEWLQEAVPAYATVGVHFGDAAVDLTTVRSELVRRLKRKTVAEPGELHVVPVCYEMQLDMARVAEVTGLTVDDVINRHADRDYAVHAVGFAPGFPYLGYLHRKLQGVPRLGTPRMRVEPGSVGLTATQTGIYPLARPGGWNIIGRTPLIIVDVEAGFFPIQVGDLMRFRRIDEAEFRRWDGKRLGE